MIVHVINLSLRTGTIVVNIRIKIFIHKNVRRAYERVMFYFSIWYFYTHYILVSLRKDDDKNFVKIILF